MGMRVNLVDRTRLEQRRKKLAEVEAATKADERKARSRLLYQAGALAEKVGLLGLESDVLYGALLEIGSPDQKTVERWRKAGQVARERDEAEKAKRRELCVIVYPEAIPKITAAALRQAGFRWNRLLSAGRVSRIQKSRRNLRPHMTGSWTFPRIQFLSHYHY